MINYVNEKVLLNALRKESEMIKKKDYSSFEITSVKVICPNCKKEHIIISFQDNNSNESIKEGQKYDCDNCTW